jgi:Transposase DDE domain
VWRSFGEEYLERVRAYQPTAAYQKALRTRKVWVEPLFAAAKEWHGSRRFRLRRLRGLWRVNGEALLTAAGQNLKRLLAHHGWGRRPVPSGAALALTPLDGVVAASLPLRCGVAWELFLIVGLTICPGAQERTLTQPMWQPNSKTSLLFQHAHWMLGTVDAARMLKRLPDDNVDWSQTLGVRGCEVHHGRRALRCWVRAAG